MSAMDERAKQAEFEIAARKRRLEEKKAREAAKQAERDHIEALQRKERHEVWKKKGELYYKKMLEQEKRQDAAIAWQKEQERKKKEEEEKRKEEELERMRAIWEEKRRQEEARKAEKERRPRWYDSGSHYIGDWAEEMNPPSKDRRDKMRTFDGKGEFSTKTASSTVEAGGEESIMERAHLL